MEYSSSSPLNVSKQKGLHPDLRSTRIEFNDFVCISNDVELLEFMQQAHDTNLGIRVISSGWSWNRIIEADDDARNVIFTGHLSSYCQLDAQKRTATVAGGLMLADFLKLNANFDVEWPPKGGCFTPNESQCFAGFIATNVHHSYLPTAYDWVNSITVAVWVDGKASLVRASRDENSELFESCFGAVGITGIIVYVEVVLRPITWYHMDFQKITYSPYSAESVLMRIFEPNCYFGILPHEHIVSFWHWRTLDKAAEREQYVIPTNKCGAWVNLIAITLMLNTPVGPYLFTPRSTASKLFYFFEDVCMMDAVVPYYTAFSAHFGRAEALRKGNVAMKSTVGEVAAFCAQQHYKAVANILSRHLVALGDDAAFVIVIRYLKKSGGIVAPNSESDVVVVEFMNQPTAANQAIMAKVFDEIYDAGIRMTLHPGKMIPHHKVFREALTNMQRERLTQVVTKFDKQRLFDRGKVHWNDIYDMNFN